ncbi:hypothetical protein DRP53_02395 [candidate division WOR-3 bacterium]|uniref:STAS/SEC14 domain-containing protein n=1 Tax=candidate division WOR-3 bacterium TaxID=2052148 RepID=A0A660SM80_UNCW3|nr:MAG: hypothetical protein DRP53_02395 [candidate division WOR-3 bacterium]
MDILEYGGMMAIRVDFEYDEERNILFSFDHAELKTKEDVDQFFQIYEEKLRGLNRKVYAISNIDDLKIHPEVAEYYGERVKGFLADFFLGHARYATDYEARVMLRNAYLRAKVPAHIFDTKEEALTAIEEMKGKEQR